MAYSTISKPSLHFNTKTTTGTGNSQAVTGLGFQPDWIWGKRRDGSGNHTLFDAVRGITKGLESNGTGSEFTSTDYYSSFDSDGFTIAAGGGGAGNANGNTAVQWCWKANGAGSSNTDGSINTTATSVNTTAGISIITYTGTGSAATIGHGLGVVPDFWMVKARSETRAWYGWCKGMSYGDVINWSHSGAKSTDASLFTSSAPTNQVINLGNSVGVNNSGQTFVCYAFSSIKGFSKMGSYTGTQNANGNFIYLGFEPAYIMFKNTGANENWAVFDNKRDNYYNPVKKYLQPNDTAADQNSLVDFLSNGFKLRQNEYRMTQANKIIYMAFAKHPLVANVGQSIPTTAR
tara:strand:- start:34 stop:1074 length:1041 start_codon:yes stop_codon:yes gene_type:complete